MAADTDNDNGNGRISTATAIARLSEKVDYMRGDLSEIKVDTKKLLLTVSEHGQQIEDNCAEIERLRGSSNLKDFLLACGAILAGVLGVNK
jgi:hypothetical protein